MRMSQFVAAILSVLALLFGAVVAFGQMPTELPLVPAAPRLVTQEEENKLLRDENERLRAAQMRIAQQDENRMLREENARLRSVRTQPMQITNSGTTNYQAAIVPPVYVAPQDRVIHHGFQMATGDGLSIGYNSRAQNATEMEVYREQQRADATINKLIDGFSYGGHVLPPPQTIVVQQPCAPPPAPYCSGYRNCYGLTPPRAMLYAPPGAPIPGCSCAGHLPGEPCRCAPGCRTCGGNMYLRRP